jgi:hypothetical protein
MTLIHTESGDYHLNSEFYIDVLDMNRILGTQNVTAETLRRTELAEVFKIGDKINGKIMLQFKNQRVVNRGINKGRLYTSAFKLTDQNAINIYFYLMGACRNNDLITEFSSFRDLPVEPENLGVGSKFFTFKI